MSTDKMIPVVALPAARNAADASAIDYRESVNPGGSANSRVCRPSSGERPA